jgi:hypothetical protein
VAKLLDGIEDDAGPVAADKVLAFLSGLFNWYASRHDSYSSPIVKGMRRSKPSERARDRILGDNELRAVWKAAEEEAEIKPWLASRPTEPGPVKGAAKAAKAARQRKAA